MESLREGPLQEDRGVSDVRQGEERLPNLPPRPHLRSPGGGARQSAEGGRQPAQVRREPGVLPAAGGPPARRD